MRICECCGREFEPKQKRSKYCSRECSIKGFHQSRTKGTTKTCVWCGKEFFTEHRGTKYCSPSCRLRAADEQRRVSEANRKPKYEPRACLYCGKEFTPREARQKYCSRDCSAMHHRIIYKSLAKEKPKKKQEYQYKKYEGVETAKPETVKPKIIEKLSPASQRWAKMSWMELTKELEYYGIRYKDAQIMAKNNTLPEDFGLKRKKVK